MGKTKNQSEIVTDMMTRSVTRSTQSCTTSSITSQKVVISNVKNSTISGIVVRQQISVKINCQVNMDLANKIQEDIANQIMNSNKDTSQAVLSGLNSLFGGGSKTTNTTKLLTTLKKDFSVDNIQKMVNAVNTSQEFTIDTVEGSNINNITIDQQSTFVADAISKIVSRNDLITAMKTNESNTNVSEEKNPVSDVIGAAGGAASGIIDSAGSAASGVIDSSGNAAGNVAQAAILGLIMPFIFIIILIIVIVVIYKFLFKSKPNNNDYPAANVYAQNQSAQPYTDQYGQQQQNYGPPPDYGQNAYTAPPSQYYDQSPPSQDYGTPQPSAPTYVQ